MMNAFRAARTGSTSEVGKLSTPGIPDRNWYFMLCTVTSFGYQDAAAEGQGRQRDT